MTLLDARPGRPIRILTIGDDQARAQCVRFGIGEGHGRGVGREDPARTGARAPLPAGDLHGAQACRPHPHRRSGGPLSARRDVLRAGDRRRPGRSPQDRPGRQSQRRQVALLQRLHRPLRRRLQLPRHDRRRLERAHGRRRGARHPGHLRRVSSFNDEETVARDIVMEADVDPQRGRRGPSGARPLPHAAGHRHGHPRGRGPQHGRRGRRPRAWTIDVERALAAPRRPRGPDGRGPPRGLRRGARRTRRRPRRALRPGAAGAPHRTARPRGHAPRGAPRARGATRTSPSAPAWSVEGSGTASTRTGGGG